MASNYGRKGARENGDIATRAPFEDAIESFAGSAVVISHKRPRFGLFWLPSLARPNAFHHSGRQASP